MGRVTGIGGIFFKAEDPEKLYQWYEKHLGIKRAPHGHGIEFVWKDDAAPDAMTVWSIFSNKTKYLEPGTASFMINYRVEDLDGLLETMKADGVEIDPKREDENYGRFAWVVDPEGNKIELWEPPKPAAS